MGSLRAGTSCSKPLTWCATSLLYRPPLILLILLIQEIFLIVLVHLLDRGVQAEDVLVLVVLVPFVEAFQRRFEGLQVLLIYLNLLGGCWQDRCSCLLIAAQGRTP